MSDSTLFRSPDQELAKLAEELEQARLAVQDASKKLSQIEGRIRKVFPSLPSTGVPRRAKVKGSESIARNDSDLPSHASALELYEELVSMVSSDGMASVERRLRTFDIDYLNNLRKHLGLSLGKEKATSDRVIRMILNRINQSAQLIKPLERRSLT